MDLRLVGASGLVILSVMALTAVGSGAYADRVAEPDSNDTRGPLDVARVVAKHRRGHPNVFIHKMVMQAQWESTALESEPRANRFITVTFDVRRDVGYHCTGCITEREVMITFARGKLRATLYNHLGDPPRRLRSLPVWRSSKRAVAFSVTRKQLRRSDYSSYDWGVETYYERRGSRCPPNNACSDLVPDDRNTLITHVI